MNNFSNCLGERTPNKQKFIHSNNNNNNKTTNQTWHSCTNTLSILSHQTSRKGREDNTKHINTKPLTVARKDMLYLWRFSSFLLLILIFFFLFFGSNLTNTDDLLEEITAFRASKKEWLHGETPSPLPPFLSLTVPDFFPLHFFAECSFWSPSSPFSAKRCHPEL